jgi:hypothetical protein
LFYIGKAHTGPKTHLTDLVGCRGISFLHGEIDVFDTGPHIVRAYRDRVGLDVDGNHSGRCMDGYIHRGLIYNDSDPLDDILFESQLLKSFFYPRRAFSGNKEIFLAYLEFKRNLRGVR